jgi:hypothetical protein
LRRGRGGSRRRRRRPRPHRRREKGGGGAGTGGGGGEPRPRAAGGSCSRLAAGGRRGGCAGGTPASVAWHPCGDGKWRTDPCTSEPSGGDDVLDIGVGTADERRVRGPPGRTRSGRHVREPAERTFFYKAHSPPLRRIHTRRRTTQPSAFRPSGDSQRPFAISIKRHRAGAPFTFQLNSSTKHRRRKRRVRPPHAAAGRGGASIGARRPQEEAGPASAHRRRKRQGRSTRAAEEGG